MKRWYEFYYQRIVNLQQPVEENELSTQESAISTQENDDTLNISSNKCIILQSFEIIFKKNRTKSTKSSLFS